MARLISSKHLEGVSDLTLSAPIKQGFIDAFEAVTYETRLRTIMDALFRIRATAREHSSIKPFVDTAERIQTLLDFRLAIHRGELLLSATFDKPLEPYMRLIWDPLGPLLDVIFCNCEGYVTATEHGFPEYLEWVRKSQIDTDFFYASSGHSISDIRYVTQLEKLEREAAKGFSAGAVTVEDPKEAALNFLHSEVEDTRKQSSQLGMEALVALYKLADFYPPDRPRGDGKYLLWATKQLLEGWGRKDLAEWGWDRLVKEQLAWIEREGPPKRQASGERLVYSPDDIQGGILSNYGGGTDRPVLHGALLLMRIQDAVKARAFVGGLSRPGEKDAAKKAAAKKELRLEDLRIQIEGEEGGENRQGTFLNLAFTRHGLASIGLPEAWIDRFPQEFREGMEDRAGLLGDVRDNHPRRWTLPTRNGKQARSSAANPPAAAPVDTPVEMSEIDIVIQLRTTEPRAPGEEGVLPGTRRQEIDRIVELLAQSKTGLELLSVEAMRRAPGREAEGIKGAEHFGFADGFSQPRPVDGKADAKRDEVPRGEIFLGYSNSRSDSPPPPSPIFDNGTFLVLRKLSQDVGGLRAFVVREAERLCREQDVCITDEDLYAKMMGRRRDGTPLVASEEPDVPNSFTYLGDKTGEACPFQSHIRRTNPREPIEDTNGRPTPRILRRGLSYGPPYPEEKTGAQAGTEEEKAALADRNAPRGVFFMAYNASIAEQFEVIQRWVSGGNSTRVASWQSDPLMGVGLTGDARTFRFVHGGKTLRVNIPDPFVKLQWGTYLFVPSMTALRTIGALAPDAHAARQSAELEQAGRGEAIVARLRDLAAQGPDGRVAAAAGWKTCLEDFSAKDPAEKDEATAVWAAIRLFHGGALKVPYGIAAPSKSPRDAVLVASKDLVMRVFRDPHGHYSMCGQMARMKQSFGEIYLGMDEGPDYAAKSKINKEIFLITEEQAFKLARNAALTALAGVFAVGDSVKIPECKIDLRRHFITPALASICHRWFGIPDVPPPGDEKGSNFIDPWTWSWEPAETRKPRCPGDYMATSRFCFYPDPTPRVRAYGKSQGQALREAVRAYFHSLRGPDHPPGEPVIAPVPNDPAVQAGAPPLGDLTNKAAAMFPDNDELARNVIGVMTGFLPPADGCMRWALYEWLDEKTLPRVQHDLNAYPSEDAYERADRALRPWLARAMQKRPAPDILWRTATRDHRLGDVDVAADERVFVGIVSALSEDAAAGIVDVYPVFGGERRATPDDPKDRDYPLHACPAYKAAMGTMLGILSALLESVRIEPLPAPMLVRVSGPNRALQAYIARATAGLKAMEAKSKQEVEQARSDEDEGGGDPPGGGGQDPAFFRPGGKGDDPGGPAGGASDPPGCRTDMPAK